MKKTLLLTNSLPGTKNVGAILLQRMLREIPELPIAIAVISQPIDERHLESYVVNHTQEIHEHASPPTANRIPQLMIAARRFAQRRDFKDQIDSISSFARANKCERVWSILSSLNLVEVTQGVADSLSAPLLTQVWDDVEYLARQRSFHGLALRILKRRFSDCLRRSEQTAVIGETMASDYAQNYDVNPVIVRLGANHSEIPDREIPHPENYTITFSGGMYCYSAFQTLLKALDLCHWRCDGRPIRLCIFSNEARIESRSEANIEYLGWRSNDEISQRLSNSDLLYLPQPFESSNYQLARLSFPTKMSDYVSTGTPIFLHAPHYASLTALSEKYGGLLTCDSLDPSVVAARIQESLADQLKRANAKKASEQISRELLTPENFRRGVRQLVGLPCASQSMESLTACVS